ncbi:RNA-binding protein Ro60 [Halyomorpha halys]|uniref:RNA-binding protein Ro60 n=1 Tax=Halyomorpha halys TaxID=286706 RepID=UPI0006D50DE1|nr:60 kDa SS-A/Ro ribonucleoprotein isoform X2 [Halyomorpha halys]
MDISPEIRLKRFLHITSETNVYSSGCRSFQNYFKTELVPSLTELIDDGKEDFVLNTIKTINEEKSSCYIEASLYILSEMAKNAKIRQKTLDVAKLLCKNAESFIIFIKLSIEPKPRVGFGRSFRKFIQEWYLSKDYLPLAEIIGAMNRYRGWRHSDIIKLAHIKCEDPAKAASFKFATYGAEEMKKQYGTIEGCEKVVSYLCTVETYRKKKDPTEVAEKIESYMLGKEHISTALLNDKKVWLALLRQMPVIQVLDHIQYMNKRKLFRGTRSWDAVFVDTLVEALTRPGAKKNDVTVNKVFKTLINYENAARIKLELASKLKQLSKKPPVICPDVVQALIKLMDIMYEKVKPTGKKYYIAIESSQDMDKRRCQTSRYTMLVEAAALIAHYFYRTEENVKIVTFNDSDIKPFPITREATVKQVIENLKAANGNEIANKKVDGNIVTEVQEEMTKEEEDFDVCIIVKSMLSVNTLSGHTIGQDNNNKTRYVVCNLCGTFPKNIRPPDLPNLLFLFGFDEKICEVISSFASGSF